LEPEVLNESILNHDIQGRISLLGGPRLKYVRGPFHYDKQTVDHKNNIALNQAFRSANGQDTSHHWQLTI